MQVVAWPDWLDRHIPYYEKNKQINRYADNPPEAILVIDPVDRNRRVAHAGFAWSTWEAMDNSIRDLDIWQNLYSWTPTHINAGTGLFGPQDEALIAVLKLS
jgi:hypothetical protein